MNGHFSEEALQALQAYYGGSDLDFSEGEAAYDFTRCVRANGTYYGTRGKCRQGTEAGPAEKKEGKRAQMRRINEEEAARIQQARVKAPRLKSFSHDSLSKYKMTPEQEAKLKRSTNHRKNVKALIQLREEHKRAKNPAEKADIARLHNDAVDAIERHIQRIKAQG
jgi:hypothetical protein